MKVIHLLSNMKPTQCDKILEVLRAAKGDWVSSRVFIREMWLSQTSARICELKKKGHNIQSSDDEGLPRDSYNYCSYRLLEPFHDTLQASTTQAIKKDDYSTGYDKNRPIYSGIKA